MGEADLKNRDLAKADVVDYIKVFFITESDAIPTWVASAQRALKWPPFEAGGCHTYRGRSNVLARRDFPSSQRNRFGAGRRPIFSFLIQCQLVTVSGSYFSLESYFDWRIARPSSSVSTTSIADETSSLVSILVPPR